MVSLTKSLGLCSTMARSQRIPLKSRASLTMALRSPYQASAPSVSKSLSTSLRLAYPRKDSQDKDSINTEATEYSKSAGDDQSAKQEEAAFDPNITDPQEQKDKAGEDAEGGSNPLDVSPANPEVSKQRGAQEGGSQNGAGGEHGSGRERTSGGSRRHAS